MPAALYIRRRAHADTLLPFHLKRMIAMPTRLRSGVVCVANGALLAIEMRDPNSGFTFLTIPGGAIESGETPAEAAIRETREESGYRVRLNESSHRVTAYPFEWNGLLYDCTTHWYLASPLPVAPEPVDDADYMLRHLWLPHNEVATAFEYHKDIQATILDFLAMD
jgi:8-oxo-dGTP pyrophosphatase MutT (NUDIX family)